MMKLDYPWGRFKKHISQKRESVDGKVEKEHAEKEV